MIRLNLLNKFYNRGKQNEIHVLNDINLELPDKGMWAIFGPSGCGKTTLLNVIGGMDELSGGEVVLEDTVMSSDNSVVRNRDVGIIFQNYNLNRDETVYENVADALRLCGMRDEETIKTRVEAALRNVGMEMFAKRLPDTLSGGQQQRVAIARAIVKNPKVILADEPTGNLDEANTILVMDILKEMSKEHLVLLVTHEANLVDYYCDTVVELKDGQIVGIRNNESANGYVARDKNEIFLGELNKKDCADENIDVAFYGEKPSEPLKIIVVNHNGRMFLRVDTPKVTVLDSASEVKLREGVYTETEAVERKESNVDMTDLPPFEGTEYGKLFGFKSSVVNGYRQNYRSMMKKKSKKRLGFCLGLFGAVIVFLTAVFSRGIKEFFKVKEEFNENVILVAATSEDISEKIIAALNDPESGIDDVSLRYNGDVNMSDGELRAYFVSFETAGFYDVGYAEENSMSVNASVLSDKLLSNMKCLTGRKDGLTEMEAVITKHVADLFLEKSPYPYISDYSDLLSMRCGLPYNAELVKIVGIVDSDEMAVYISDMDLDRLSMRYGMFRSVICDENDDYHLAPGECMVVRNRRLEQYNNDDLAHLAETELKVGDPLMLNGLPLTVAKYYDISLYDFSQRIRSQDEMTPEQKEAIQKQNEEREPLRDEIFSRIRRIDTLKTRIIIVNAEDFHKVARIIGVTSLNNNDSEKSAGEMKFDGKGTQSSYNAQGYSTSLAYYQLHSNDLKKTKEYVNRVFGGLENPVEASDGRITSRGEGAIITPEYRFQELFKSVRRTVWKLFIAWAVVLGLMCVCMLFIMKSNIMNRTREIGIYRAIGVSGKNILFRFAVEIGVVVTFSVFIGYLLSSVIVRFILKHGGMAESLLYYPWWLALLVLGFLYAVCIVCGIFPVWRILRKTPSEILAKYDI